ncbi:MAG: hypothetical protein OHK0046_35670 [Anaerolineae bacterium]
MMAVEQMDVRRMYGEYILYWLLENAWDGRQVEDFEMQDGSGLPDMEFRIGLDWLIEMNLLDRHEERLH